MIQPTAAAAAPTILSSIKHAFKVSFNRDTLSSRVFWAVWAMRIMLGIAMVLVARSTAGDPGIVNSVINGMHSVEPGSSFGVRLQSSLWPMVLFLSSVAIGTFLETRTYQAVIRQQNLDDYEIESDTILKRTGIIFLLSAGMVMAFYAGLFLIALGAMLLFGKALVPILVLTLLGSLVLAWATFRLYFIFPSIAMTGQIN